MTRDRIIKLKSNTNQILYHNLIRNTPAYNIQQLNKNNSKKPLAKNLVHITKHSK